MTPNTPLKTREEIVSLLSAIIHSRQGQKKHLWFDDCLKLAEASILELEKAAIQKFFTTDLAEQMKGHRSDNRSTNQSISGVGWVATVEA